MTVRVKLAGILKSYLGDQDAAEFQAGLSIREMITSIGIPVEVVALVLVNDKYQPKSYIAQEGDMVKLFAVVGGG
jgi:sulfur carrier protein ThiS